MSSTVLWIVIGQCMSLLEEFLPCQENHKQISHLVVSNCYTVEWLIKPNKLLEQYRNLQVC